MLAGIGGGRIGVDGCGLLWMSTSTRCGRRRGATYPMTIGLEFDCLVDVLLLVYYVQFRRAIEA